MATRPILKEPLDSRQGERVISLSVRSGEVFANREKALHWLYSPNPSLQGRNPLEAASTEDGFEQADDILARIDGGVLG